MRPTHPHPPQLLIASHNHGAGLELLELAERRGFTVRRVQSAAQALEQHHAALRAGVWEFLRHPFHAEEIGAKLDSYVRLKLDSDRARRDTSVADATGFYTVRGLALRAQELTLQAFHHAEPLACVAIAPVTADGQNADALDLLADVLRATGRRSDAIGRVGPGEFAVIAPGTDRTGAVLFAERVARGVTAAGGGG